MNCNYKVKITDIQTKYKFKVFCTGYDDSEIRSEISQRALISEAGRYVELELDPNTYVLTAKLKDKNNNVISTSTPIDLPLESMIVNATYDSTTKSLIITLQNGNTTSIPLGDLIDGLATEEDLNEVRNELNQYKTIYNVLPKVEDEGEALTLSDTGNATLKIDLKGNDLSQFSTQGYSLYDFINNTYTPDTDIEVVELDNGYRIKNTGSEQHRIGFLDVNVDSSKDYVISFEINNPSGSSAIVGWAGSNKTITTSRTSGKVTGALTGITSSFFSLYVVQTNATIEFTNIMIYERTDTTKEYEPYTGGNPAPNPDYPQDIHVVSGDNSIDVCGNNLVQNKYIDNSTSAYQDVLWVEGDLKPNTTYTIQFIGTIGNRIYNNENLFTASGYYDIASGVNVITITTKSEMSKTTGSQYTNGKGWRIFKNSKNQSSANVFNDLQIEKGSTATTYEPYTGASYPINLGDIELCKIGDYQDYIYKDNKKWYKYGAIGKVVLNGSENWTYQSQYPRFTSSYNGGLLVTSTLNNDVYSNYYKVGQTSNINNTISFWTNGGSRQVLVHDERFTTKEQYNTWLSTNNVICYGILYTPTNTLIEDTTLIEQLEALKKAESYSGQTNISQTNDDKPFILTAKALKDLSNL